MPDVRLMVNGQEYRGWTAVRITRGIDAIAGSFALSVSEKWDGQAQPWPIIDGDACTLQIGNETVITGFVDNRRHQYDVNAHALSVVGRDKTADLVDSSAVLKQWEFLNTSVPEFCKALAAPFGVSVTVQPGLSIGARQEKIPVNPGETVFEAIERACRRVGALPMPDGRGGLLLTRANLSATTRDALIEGQNILAAEASYDSSRRYRTYIVSGQQAGSDTNFGDTVAAVRAQAQDLNIRAARVLLIRPEGVVTPATAAMRAQWEASVRVARGTTFSVTVQGWQQSDGALWPINALTTVRSPKIGVDRVELLIIETTYTLDQQSGTTTQLRLVPKDAYLPEPVIAKKQEAGGSAPTFLGN